MKATIKVLVWGTGVYAKKFLNDKKENVEIVGFVDNNKSLWGKQYYNKLILPLEDYASIDFDYLLITSAYNANDIYNQIVSELPPSIHTQSVRDIRDKIVSLGIFYDKNIYLNNFKKIEELLQYNYTRYVECSIEPWQINVTTKMIYDHLSKSVLNNESGKYHIDYTRYRTFELCADEVLQANLEGSTAEIGVFRGDFSRIINKKFKMKTLYLFDTFESFNKEEYKKNSDSYKQIDTIFDVDFFSSTSADFVLKNMHYPENCIIKKGYFPDTAEGLEDERFCFVSIDVDLYTPIYNSLNFFYPRLVSGGYIFIHEYNQQYFRGVHDAVREYETNSNISLKKVPLADFGGTLIITK